MGLKFEDGTGKGYLAKIGNGNRLFVDAVVADRMHITNHVDGRAFSFVIQQTPTGADDCFLYLRNISNDDLTFWAVNVAATDTIEIVLNSTGTPIGGTEVVPVNRNTGSGNTPDITFQAGSDITGLTKGNISDRIKFNDANVSEKWQCPCGIIIAPGKTLTMYAVTGGTQINITGIFEFHNAER